MTASPFVASTPGVQRQMIRRLLKAPLLQYKLLVGSANDSYEREADRVAEHVVSSSRNDMVRSVTPSGRTRPSIQRLCSHCEREMQRKTKGRDGREVEELQRKIKSSDGKEEEELQRKTAGGEETEEEEPIQTKADSGGPSEAGDEVSAGIEALQGGGSPLTKSSRNFFEPRFGHGFSGVRIHTDHRAATLARAVNAKAFTRGRDIVFGAGEYSPGSHEGKKLIAHELTHVVQQSGGQQGGVQKIQRRIGDGHDLVSARFSGNKVLEAVYDNHRLLKKGNKGTAVRLVQEALMALHYDLPTWGADSDFGKETEAAVRAFQVDTGAKVDGIVGPQTIEFLDKRDRGAEIAPAALPLAANPALDMKNVIVQPGAAPSHALGACTYGLTFPENVRANITAIPNAGRWDAVLTGLTGNYSLQYRNLPTQTEVTGPGGNTTSANHCAQVTELKNLGNCGATARWYMRSAVLAHERVHATRFRQALVDVAPNIETAVEAIHVPLTLITPNRFLATAALLTHPAFAAAMTNAQARWLARILVLVANDHNAGGVTDQAEHTIVDPMIRRICRHAKKHHWPVCAAC